MLDEETLQASEDYVDALFGPGAGHAHSKYLDTVESASVREAIHRIHLVAADTSQLSVEEHYLIGMAVLYALGVSGSAGMFARTLMHLGTSPERLIETASRLSIYLGPILAAGATVHLRKAIDDYERNGPASLDVWLPGYRSAS